MAMYQPKGYPSAMRYFKQLLELKMDPADSGAYFDKLGSLCNKLSAMGKVLPEWQLIMLGIAALPKPFEHLQKSLLLKGELIDYEEDLIGPAEEFSKAHKKR